VIVAVTGVAGSLGTRLTEELLARGDTVIGIDSLVRSTVSDIGPFADNPRFRFVQNDIRQLRVDHLRVDAIVHLAAIVGESGCDADPDEATSVNVDGTAAVLRSASAAGVSRIVFASTCSVYGVTDPRRPATESHPVHPTSSYAVTKLAAERLVTSAPMTGTALRFATLCGYSSHLRFDLLINTMAHCCVMSQPLVLYGVTASRPFLHVKDAVRAIITVLSAAPDAVRGEIFNVAAENLTKAELAGMARAYFPQLRLELRDGGESRNYRVSSEKIASLGWAPQYTVEDGFLDVVRFLGVGAGA
jgi:nucleoside-diphosphate-sugar epimerase